jgi:hypothetical protein
MGGGHPASVRTRSSVIVLSDSTLSDLRLHVVVGLLVKVTKVGVLVSENVSLEEVGSGLKGGSNGEGKVSMTILPEKAVDR